ncbi:MAG: 30S ribosomal protein S7 [Sphingobacteriia bacterium]|nr:30S ribosomal protein S7 [Sphingobacteriia bacterium]
MSRRRAAIKRKVYPDARYKNVTFQKFINRLTQRGKKSVAEKIFYKAVENACVKLKMQGQEVEFFNQVLDNIKPRLEVRSRRVGGATYQVPTVVRADRSTSLAIRWLVTFSKKRGNKSMVQRLSEEFLDAFNKRGGAFKKREDTEKMAEANKAFSHYSW